MGPFCKEKPLFKVFTPSLKCESSESASLKGQPPPIYVATDKVRSKHKNKRVTNNNRKPERSIYEQLQHSTTLEDFRILKSLETNDSKVSDPISTTTKDIQNKPRGMAANDAIAANKLRLLKKKIPVLKGLGIIAQNSTATASNDGVVTGQPLFKAQRVDLTKLFNCRDTRFQLEGEHSKGNHLNNSLDSNHSAVVNEPSAVKQSCTSKMCNIVTDLITSQSDQTQPSVELFRGVESTEINAPDTDFTRSSQGASRGLAELQMIADTTIAEMETIANDAEARAKKLSQERLDLVEEQDEDEVLEAQCTTGSSKHARVPVLIKNSSSVKSVIAQHTPSSNNLVANLLRAHPQDSMVSIRMGRRALLHEGLITDITCDNDNLDSLEDELSNDCELQSMLEDQLFKKSSRYANKKAYPVCYSDLKRQAASKRKAKKSYNNHCGKNTGDYLYLYSSY